jgi:hypothetical protein
MITQASSQVNVETLRDADIVRMRCLFRAAKEVVDRLTYREMARFQSDHVIYQRLPKAQQGGYREWRRGLWEADCLISPISWGKWKERRFRKRSVFRTSPPVIYFRLLAGHALIGSLDPDRYANRILAAERMACRMTQVLQRAGHGDLVRICLHRF